MVENPLAGVRENEGRAGRVTRLQCIVSFVKERRHNRWRQGTLSQSAVIRKFWQNNGNALRRNKSPTLS